MADINLNILTADNNMNIRNDNKVFACGVVEGFYGRPWTAEQRKDLFAKQQKWSMNCYLYAPKDDYKHRAFWRELYTVEEAENLTALITEARNHNITFYYAISPGLDITYSSQKEMASLKRKLEQVQQLGCNAFAILFDDIDPEMSGADKEMFQSFANAQVSVTNEIFAHLNQPKFMFCPTQYCSSRAVPSVQASEYLSTLGSKLAPDINIMWTGPKVISKTLTADHIREVTEVIKRPPIIWDNLHANDYDQARLFMGPYCGRSPDLIKLLRGVVANPNCEFGPNFIAIHTLAQWAKSSNDTSCDNDAVSADIRLETEGDESNDDCPTGLPATAYHPRRALKLALMEWLPEFNKSNVASGPICQPQIPIPILANAHVNLATPLPLPILPSVNTCMTLTTTTTVPPCLAPTTNMNLIVEAISDSNFTPCLNPVMNSLVSETKVVLNSVSDLNPNTDEDIISQGSTPGLEPMDCNPSPQSPPVSISGEGMLVESSENDRNAEPKKDEDVKIEEADSPKLLDDKVQPPSITESRLSDVSNDTSTAPTNGGNLNESSKFEELSIEDLQLLTDLFYLPFEHGRTGLTFLKEFNWLKMNSQLVRDINPVENGEKMDQTGSEGDGCLKQHKPEVQEWYDRAAKFKEMTKSVKAMADRLVNIKNRTLLYELYPYVWDMRGVVSLLNSCVEWLALGKVSALVCNYVHGNYTWFSKGWKEAFMAGDQEPWVFRGGLTAELQRLIPVDASNDLFIYKTPDFPMSVNYVLRPYLPDEDRKSIYSLILRAVNDGRDDPSMYQQHPDLLGDVTIGCYLESLTDCVLMVVEGDREELIAYCLADNSAVNYKDRQTTYLEKLKNKYPKVTLEEGMLQTPMDSLLSSLWEPVDSIPESIASQHPTSIRFGLIPSLKDESIIKRMLTCVLASLRSQGIFSGHIGVRTSNTSGIDFASRLGFREVLTTDKLIYFARSF